MTDVLFDFFFFKQKTAYELRISDWSSDVCSSDLLDGIGPRELGLEQLASRLATGEVQELIIATNPTVEGEATAHYLAQLARNHGVRPSRLAHGVPLGGELEYVDRGTLRTEARRGGKGCGRTCRSRWAPYDEKKKK